MKTDTNLDFRKNSLTTFRFLAAIYVLVTHTLVHLQIPEQPLLMSILGIVSGVPVFFMLSGFLIWRSIGRSSSFKHYLSKRFWRIYPELWIGVAIEIIMILLLFKETVDWLQLSAFTFTQGTIFQFWTPDFLRTYGCGVPNGSLWTIGVTIQFYFIVWFLYKFLHNKNIWRWIACILISFVIKAASPYLADIMPNIIYKLYLQTIVPYLWLFTVGIFVSEYFENIVPVLKKIWWLLIILSFIIEHFKFDVGTDSYGLFTYTLRVLGVIGFAYLVPVINIKKDISYGIYIYHMTVVNVMLELGIFGKLWHLFIVIAITFVLAFLSSLISDFIVKKRSKKSKI